MRVLFCIGLVLLGSCSHFSGSFKDCASRVAETNLLRGIDDSINCGEDKQCLIDKARQDALTVAADLEQCLPAQNQDGGK